MTNLSPADEARAVVRRFVDDLKNLGDPTAAPEIIGPGFINHTAPPEQLSGGDLFSLLRRAVPDLRVEIIDQVAETGKVCTYQRFSGTNTGSIAGETPTGNPVSWDAIDIVTVIDGRIREHWAVVDSYAMLSQLNLL